MLLRGKRHAGFSISIVKTSLFQRLVQLAAVSRRSRYLVRQADRARDDGDWTSACLYYERAIAGGLDDAALHVQCGHAHKEAGHLEAAEAHYLYAKTKMPNNADLHLQLGHFYKVSGRWDEAVDAYMKAVKLSPGVPEPFELRFARRKQAAELVVKLLEDNFEGEQYLEINPELRDIKMDPFDHFIQFGVTEGRALQRDAASIQMTKERWQQGLLKTSGMLYSL